MWRERVVRYWNPVARAAAMLGGVLWYATRDVSYSYPQAGLIATAFAGLAIGLTLEVILARIGGLRGRALAASGGISLALCLAAVAWIELNGTFSSSEMGSGAWWTGSYWYVVLVTAAVLIAAYLEPAHSLMVQVLAGSALAVPIIDLVRLYTTDAFSANPQPFGFAFFVFSSLSWVLAWGAVGTLALYVRRVIRSRREGTAAARRLVPAAGALAYVLVLAGVVLWIMAVNLESTISTTKLLDNTFAARLVASELQRSFDTTQLVEAGPAVQKRLLELSLPTSLWAFTLVDRKTGAIVLAERIAPAPGGGWLSSRAPRIVTLSAKRAADIGDEIRSGRAGLYVGGPGVMWTDWHYASAPIGDWTTATLDVVVSDPMIDLPEYRPAVAGDDFRQLVDAHLPWLFAALLLPVSLALLVLEKREAARTELLFAQERARIGRDAHDRVYNRLAALAGHIESGGVGVDPTVPAGEIRGALSDLQRILGDVDARTATSGDAGARLFDDLVSDQSARWNMAVELHGRDALAELDPRLAWELQCVVEEALTNAGKHSNAGHVVVTASREGGRVRIVVTDDGCGIASALEADGLPSKAHGLRGVTDRMHAAGGTMSLTTSDHGTTVTVDVPV